MGLLGVSPTTSVIQGNPPLYEQNRVWEALSVVSQKWSFPTALLSMVFHLFGMAFWWDGSFFIEECYEPLFQNRAHYVSSGYATQWKSLDAWWDEHGWAVCQLLEPEASELVGFWFQVFQPFPSCPRAPFSSFFWERFPGKLSQPTIFVKRF